MLSLLWTIAFLEPAKVVRLRHGGRLVVRQSGHEYERKTTFQLVHRRGRSGPITECEEVIQPRYWVVTSPSGIQYVVFTGEVRKQAVLVYRIAKLRLTEVLSDDCWRPILVPGRNPRLLISEDSALELDQPTRSFRRYRFGPNGMLEDRWQIRKNK